MDNKTERAMWDAFLSIGKDALYSDHYELHKLTGLYNPQIWKEFLLLPSVVEHIRIEMEIIRKSAINELFANAGDSNSVGKAQLVNAIAKYDVDNSEKEGPIFIYTYVPLNPEQKKAENVRILKEDIFLADKDVHDANAPSLPTRRP